MKSPFMIALFVAVFGFGGLAVGQSVPQSKAEITLSFSPVVKRAAPAVVNVYTRKSVKRRNPFAGDPFFERFFREFGGLGSGRKMQNSLGSGVIMTSDGFVVTNNHVVEGADAIRVVLHDKREFEAKIVFADAQSDLSILKLSGAHGLPTLKFRNSDELEVGDLVLAIGNPFGVGQTVTSGIVSALARSQASRTRGRAGGYFIQTDAAVNPGNSGGALVDMAGRLIGVNTAIVTRSGGSNGIGFAVPANLVKQALDSALAGETTLNRPWLGITGQKVTADIADALGMDVPNGVIITAIHPLSPLLEAGMKKGDVIVAYDSQPVSGLEELAFRIAASSIGSFVKFEFLRGTKSYSADVKLRAVPVELRR
ncbi:MAG: trypsin-like peptidase domain-containing protein [Pikeienuella sp.]